MTAPTLAGFQAFVTGIMGVPSTALDINGAIVTMAYQIAVDLVNPDLAILSDATIINDLYSLAVYNLAASNLINYAPDLSTYPKDANGNGYFAAIRAQWGLNSFSPGIVQSTSDVSTSTSMMLPDFVSNLSLADLQTLKDPYGRRYMAIAQKAGSLWGIS